MKARIAVALALLAGMAGIILWASGRSNPAPLITDATLRPLHGGGWALEAKIDNRGGWDVLRSAHSPEARTARFAPAAGPQIALPAASSPSLSLDGVYLRLDGLEGNDGQLVPVTFVFDRAGEVTARARVEMDAQAGHMGHAMPGHGALMDLAPGDAPTLAMTLVPDGDGWTVALEITRLTLSAEAVDSPHEPGEGHGHLYLNGLKLGRVFSDRLSMGALPPGQHHLRVSLNTNDHRPYATGGTPIEALALIDVPQ